MHNETNGIACIYDPPDKSTYRLPKKVIPLFFQIINSQAADCIMVTGDSNMKKTNWVSITSSDVYYEDEILDEVDRLNLTLLNHQAEPFGSYVYQQP